VYPVNTGIEQGVSIKRTSLLPYFLASVLLLLILFSLYVFYESRWLQQEFTRQVETKGLALTEAMEKSATQAIEGNSLIQELVSQRLLDNARLIDKLLLTHPPDPELLQEITRLNGLQKIELLDLRGRPWPVSNLADMQAEMNNLFAQLQGEFGDVNVVTNPDTILYVWGKLWSQHSKGYSHPRRLVQSSFWKGSVFGVAVGAQSFPGIIAVRADSDYVLNFQKEIGVQHQIEELGRQSDIQHVALLDNSFKVVAHTDPSLIGKTLHNDFVAKAAATQKPVSRMVWTKDRHRRFELIRPISLNGARLGFLEIGLSMDSADSTWKKSLWSKLILGAGILGLGIVGLAAIFYNQRSHMREIKSLEAEVNRREHLSMMGNLASTVAHEVRNPLNSISMGLQRLKAEFRPVQDEAEYSHFIELMRGEVQRLNSIVEQFLSLARPLALKPHEIRIRQLMSELTTLTESNASASNVKIRLVTRDPSLIVTADPDYLKQVLLNLILNGIQAMPNGGTLTLEATTSRGKRILKVSDTGIGIPKEHLGRIFEPYFTTKANGSGLGLAIARRIVEEHGGTISVTSEPQRGSRFEIVLPKTSKTAAAVSDQAAVPV
jgi:signal transduction histidine kinase